MGLWNILDPFWRPRKFQDQSGQGYEIQFSGYWGHKKDPEKYLYWFQWPIVGATLFWPNLRARKRFLGQFLGLWNFSNPLRGSWNHPVLLYIGPNLAPSPWKSVNDISIKFVIRKSLFQTVERALLIIQNDMYMSGVYTNQWNISKFGPFSEFHP